MAAPPALETATAPLLSRQRSQTEGSFKNQKIFSNPLGGRAEPGRLGPPPPSTISRDHDAITLAAPGWRFTSLPASASERLAEALLTVIISDRMVTVIRQRALKAMSKSHLKLVSPGTEKRTVTRGRKPNEAYRKREHLTQAEVDRLIEAAKANRWGHRDATMILVAYRHGLRASELVDLRWNDIDFDTANMHVTRVKQGSESTHPILGDEMRALRRLRREHEHKSPNVFTSERGAPFTTAGFARLVERAGESAGLGFPAHPHMLRHATGFALANAGHDTRAIQAYLGHKNIQHTVRYTALSPTRFKDFFRK
jgi:type 1 fimbriae regulatory protein FimB/type 1 fimbriae regulatory protein FimE